MPLLDLFTPNELEACAVAGVPAGDVEAALARLSRQVNEYVESMNESLMTAE